MVKSLLTSSSTYDEILTSVNGTFNILPGQFILLDNQMVTIDSSSFKIITNDTPNKIFNYSINDKVVKLLQGETTYVVEIKLDNQNKYNVADPDEVDNLLSNGLLLKTPTNIYMMYQPGHNLFTIKNINMGTLFMMKKIK
tara:strand:+ start:1333 stop:1752 length:420 start_codon:yes stop_codon:yes gene_type:complete